MRQITEAPELVSSDFAFVPVPESRRVLGTNIFLTWIGFILVVVSMSFGGGLAAQMDAVSFWVSVIVGNAVLAVCAFGAGYAGSVSGLTFGSLAARIFNKNGWRLAILYIPLTLIGWYAIESSIFGNFVADTFHLSDANRRIIMAGAAIFFSISAYIGVRFIGRVSYVLIPTVLAIAAFALLRVDHAALAFGFNPPLISIWAGTAIVMSTWIFSALLVIPDLTRFVRSPLWAGIIGAGGVFVGNTLALGIGAFAAAYTKQSDPAMILVGLGYMPLALVLTFASVWSTNDNNMYSSSLNVARVLQLPRRSVVLALAFLGAVIALFNPANISTMFAVLGFMGASAPPLGGMVIGAYLFRGRGAPPSHSVIAPWLAWLVSTAVAFKLPSVAVVPGGLILGYVLWYVSNAVEYWFISRYRVSAAE